MLSHQGVAPFEKDWEVWPSSVSLGVAQAGVESLLFLPSPLAFRGGTVPAYLPPFSPPLKL